MDTRVSSILVALALVGLAAGCSKSPTAKYDASLAAIENARQSGVEQYAPELFKEASDSLNAALLEMQKQDGRFSLFRGYGKAEEMIVEAQRLVDEAAVNAANEKERVRLADSVMIAEVDSLIVVTRKSLSTAPKGKGSRVDLKVMQSDIDAAVGALTAATQKYHEGDYLVAQQELQAVKGQVLKVKTDIENAIAKLSKK